MKNIFTFETNQKILRVAAVAELCWGFLLIFMPAGILGLLGMEFSAAGLLWQLAGAAGVVLGVGYFIASYDPEKHWLIVLVGLMGRSLTAILFAKAMLSGALPVMAGTIFLLSTLIWILPFFFILQAVYTEAIKEDSPAKKFNDLIRIVKTSQNISLFELSNTKNVLLVFVRHFGCTFCRETVAEMAKVDQLISERNLTLVFVHMSDPSFGDEFFSKYYNHPVHHISDPGRVLYKSLGLKRGTLSQLFGPRTLIRGFYAGICKGHGLGALEGDSLQLGGVFVLSHGQIIFERKADSASDLFEMSALPER